MVAGLVTLLLVACSLTSSGGRDVYSRRDDAAASDDVSKSEDRALLEKMTSAVELGLKFFSQDYSSVNVDGLFGMRVGQGQMLSAVEDCKSSPDCPEELEARLQTIADNIGTTADRAMDYVEDADKAYFERFIGTVNGPYLFRYRPTTLTPEQLAASPPGHNARYDEESGDACLARIMGTFEEKGRKVDKCNITEDCWRMMTDPGRSEYAITHQLLYFIVIEKEGCVDLVEQTMQADVADTETRMCTSIFNEAEREVKNGHVREMGQDMFLEQVLVCGSLGYENFMRRDWMRMVAKWQRPSGCFSINDDALLNIQMQLSEAKKKQEAVLKDLKWEAEMIEKQHQHTGMRKLLREQMMKDGCLSHKSGLGFGTLCLYARVLLRHVYLQ